MKIILTIALGIVFGSILISSEVFHWYRIQEMFHFDSFHMYGVLGSAIATATVSLLLIKRFKVKSISGKQIDPQPKEKQPIGNIAGGLIFGMGWGLTGACTGPILILVGLKWEIGVILLIGALLGTLLFATVKSKLPR
ncbi:MAG: YeeE/YedE thiosulfate transporter family protein [Crocinitomicaceae bacterium]|nr:YeeE/YedE thiosulfate transporter family protein [Crocinitomicaceae bacterium]